MKQITPMTKNTVALALALTLTVALCALSLGITCTLATNKAFADDDYAVAAMATDKASNSTSTGNATAKSKLTKAQKNAFKKSAANFSIDLFQRCVTAGSSDENITVSPLSIMNALAVTANGAAGDTSKQMRDVLGNGMSMKQLNKSLSWFNKKLVNSKKAKLRSANSIWYDDESNMKVKKKFLKTAAKYYDAEIEQADFSNPQTVDNINNWVAEKTNNMIKRIVTQLEDNSRLVIINALYFDAKWASSFEKSAVHDATFTTASGAEKTVEMMYGEEHRYIADDGACGFVKPYAKGYSYVALLPDEGTTLQDYIATLDGAKFRKLVKNASYQQVRIGLPKYTVEYTNEAMQNQLIDMGMVDAFSYNADFSKMGTVKDGNLYLDSVIHKTKVEVDEGGTKAAAATAVIVGNATSVEKPQPKIVILDRPFVYAIVDNSTSLPIFIGTVNTIGE